VDFGARGLGMGLAGAEEDVALFKGAEEADEEGGSPIGGAAIPPEVASAELAVAMDDGAAHGPILVRALSPGFFL
jgi:hypothetical protein